MRTARVCFGVQPMGEGFGTIEPWAPGETPILEAPNVADLDFKRPESLDPTATGSRPRREQWPTRARGPAQARNHKAHHKHWQTTFNGVGQGREMPDPNAIYFEARGNRVRGQIADDAQVSDEQGVLRLLSQQCMRRRLPERPSPAALSVHVRLRRYPGMRLREPDAWERAGDCARDARRQALDRPERSARRRVVLAYWVRPRWVREMSRGSARSGCTRSTGRARNWGDGSDAPQWGDPAATEEAENKL